MEQQTGGFGLFQPDQASGPEEVAGDLASEAGEPAAGFEAEFGEPGADFEEPAEQVDEPAAEFGVPPGGPRPATGEARVDAALARLDELAGRPVTEHRAIFEDVHRRLRDVLGELDTRQAHAEDQPGAAGRAGR
jgi:hypothetical protein